MPNLDGLVLPARRPTAERPFSGLTLLLVEDSQVSCEAMRLLCRRSGARLRRAGSLAAAERHLRAYRPDVVVADIHLPDGSGLRLIEGLARISPRVDALLALSGDPDQEAPARAAGADGFLLKPTRLRHLQSAVLDCLPPERRPVGWRPIREVEPAPDMTAFRADLERAESLLGAKQFRLDQITDFLRGVAKSAGDAELLRLTESAASTRRAARLRSLLQQRLAATPPLI